MRFLGADPKGAADDTERLVMVHLQKRIVGLKDKAIREAMRNAR